MPIAGLRLYPNKPQHTGKVCIEQRGYHLAMLEFDDQGQWFEPNPLEKLTEKLKELKNPIIIVFVHGWRHNARAKDCNLLKFEDVLATTVAEEHCRARSQPRPVLGVFAAWRGLSFAGASWLEWLTFWGRQQAADRVAHGSVRELLGVLKAYRNVKQADGKLNATLILIGHSFGGRIVYIAIAQSLIEAAATSSANEVTPSFGDLVLLVNPAFSAISYLPIVSIAERRQFCPQFPVFISVTALNDWATNYAYPAGNISRIWTEATRGGHERKALIRTMGHLDWLRTHKLTQTTNPGAPTHALKDIKVKGAATYGTVTVTPILGKADTPFWVASATKNVIDGHNRIFTRPFIDFVTALVKAKLHQTG